MKKILAGAMALVMALSMCACAKSDDNTKTEEPNQEDDGLVTVYQRVSVTHYLEDGSRGYRQHLYTYDDRGNLLAMETDMGPDEEEFDEENNVYITRFKPYDGTINVATYFLYTQEGHIRFTDTIYAPAIENGNLLGDLPVENDLYYTYLEDGRIDTVEIYKSNATGPLYDEPTISYKCSYNENKQITSCVCTTPAEEGTDLYARIGDWKYDQQGRLIEERYYQFAGTRCNRFTYNEQGLLATAEFGYVNTDIYGKLKGTEEKFSAMYASFTCCYDEAGRIIDPESNSICYDADGRLIAYGDVTISYNADGSKKVCDGDDVYEFDQHGNLIRYPWIDGYFEVEYREFRVTKDEAKRLENRRMLLNTRDGYAMRGYAYEFMATIDFPEIPLCEYEMLLSGDIRF